MKTKTSRKGAKAQKPWEAEELSDAARERLIERLEIGGAENFCFAPNVYNQLDIPRENVCLR